MDVASITTSVVQPPTSYVAAAPRSPAMAVTPTWSGQQMSINHPNHAPQPPSFLLPPLPTMPSMPTMPVMVRPDYAMDAARMVAPRVPGSQALPIVRSRLAMHMSGFRSLAQCLPSGVAMPPSHEFMRKARRVGLKTVPFSDEDVRRAVEARGGFHVVNQKGSRGLWKRIARDDLRWCMHATTKPCSCGQNLKNRFLQLLAENSQYRLEVVAVDDDSDDHTHEHDDSEEVDDHHDESPSDEEGSTNDASTESDHTTKSSDPEHSKAAAGKIRAHALPAVANGDEAPHGHTVRVWQTKLPATATVNSLPLNSRVMAMELDIGAFHYEVRPDMLEDETLAAASSLRMLQERYARDPQMLDVKILYGRQKIEYTMTMEGRSHKIDMAFGSVSALSVNADTHVIALTLSQQPEFWEEVPSNHKNGKRYVRCEDFTRGQAFYYRVHYIRFADNEVLRHLAILKGFDTHFGDLPAVDHDADPRFPILPFLCGHDRENLALIYCVDCAQSFCNDCNEQIHRWPSKQGHFQRPITGHASKKRKSVTFDRCRCGTSGALHGTSPSLSCAGKRCPCYAEGRGCRNCGCRNCKNPCKPPISNETPSSQSPPHSQEPAPISGNAFLAPKETPMSPKTLPHVEQLFPPMGMFAAPQRSWADVPLGDGNKGMLAMPMSMPMQPPMIRPMPMDAPFAAMPGMAPMTYAMYDPKYGPPPTQGAYAYYIIAPGPVPYAPHPQQQQQQQQQQPMPMPNEGSMRYGMPHVVPKTASQGNPSPLRDGVRPRADA